MGGELLRGTLEATLLAQDTSTEGVIELEYTFLALPPQLDDSIPQADWCAHPHCPQPTALTSTDHSPLRSLITANCAP